MIKLLLVLDKLAKVFSGETGPFNNDPAVSLNKIYANHAATTAHVGLVELATTEESAAGASSSLVTTPAGVEAAVPAIAKQHQTVAAGTLTARFPLHYQITPALGTADAILEATALTAASQNPAPDAQPDVPRTISIKGSAEGMTGNVQIFCTTFEDEVINVTLALNGTTEVFSTVAVKAVTAIVLPPKTNAEGDAVTIGVGDVIGMPHIVPNASCLLVALFDGSADTGGTLAVDADEVEKNLYTPAGTFDGEKVLDLIYLV
jgi:hypothetical protein